MRVKDTIGEYLRIFSWSKEKLINTLIDEGCNPKTAREAVENYNFDWKKQAVRAAKSYLGVSLFSYDMLVQQLEHDGFTHEEALYGADHCEADWDKQAKALAEIYKAYTPYAKELLLLRGFTTAQVERSLQ